MINGMNQIAALLFLANLFAPLTLWGTTKNINPNPEGHWADTCEGSAPFERMDFKIETQKLVVVKAQYDHKCLRKNLKSLETWTFSIESIEETNPEENVGEGRFTIAGTVESVERVILTEAYVQVANSDRFDGFNDWQVNTPKNLAGRYPRPPAQTPFTAKHFISGMRAYLEISHHNGFSYADGEVFDWVEGIAETRGDALRAEGLYQICVQPSDLQKAIIIRLVEDWETDDPYYDDAAHRIRACDLLARAAIWKNHMWLTVPAGAFDAFAGIASTVPWMESLDIFLEGSEQEINLSQLHNLKFLTGLAFSPDEGPDLDFAQLLAFKYLNWFDVIAKSVRNSESLSQLDYLYSLSVHSEQIEPLAIIDLPLLETLRLDQRNTTTTPTLKNLPKLNQLTLSTNSSDFGDISQFTKLTKLRLYSENLEDLSPLAALSKLTDLSVKGAYTDLEPLRELRNIESLSLTGNFDDLSVIARFANLDDLWIGHSPNLVNLAPIEECTKLTSLVLIDLPVKSLLPLGALTMRDEYGDLGVLSLIELNEVGKNDVDCPTHSKNEQLGAYCEEYINSRL